MDMNTALALKYQILGQQADAQTTQADAIARESAERTRLLSSQSISENLLRQAQANQMNETAKMVNPLGMSQIGLHGAQAGYMNASADLHRQNAAMVQPLAIAQIGLQGTQGAENLSRSGYFGAQTTGQNINNFNAGNWAYNPTYADMAAQAGAQSVTGNLTPQPAPTGYPTVANPYPKRRPLGGATPRYSKGTNKVPGKGDGTVDTVDAKLAPGEAVLNKAAAEHLGRDLIDVLNAIGARKMGMSKGKGKAKDTDNDKEKGPNEPDGDEGGKVGFAQGTSWVDNANAAVDAAAARNGQAVYSPGMPSAPPSQTTPQPPKVVPGYAQGTSFVQGFGAPSAPQESSSAYAAALAAQNPQSVQNVVADIRAKLTGGATATPRLYPGGR